MEQRPEDEGAYRVLPDQAKPCIWMVAGILSYRLCDRDYDCEQCPLDAAIRGGQPVEAAATAEVSANEAWGIRDGLSYHPVYGWVAAVGKGRVRWGVDGWTARLLDRVSGIILPAVGTSLLRGKVACWVADDGELVPLRAPLSAKVARTNRALQDDPPLLAHDPYDGGWLLEFEGGAGVLASQPWVGARERREHATEQARRLHRAALGYLRAGQEVGPTAPDGGVPVSDLRRLLGPLRYHRLVGSVLR